MLTYTTKQLADELHTSRNKIYLLRKAGKLPAIRIGKDFIYYEKDVREFIENSRGMDYSDKESIERGRKFD